MYGRLLTVAVQPDDRATMEAIAAQFALIYQSLKGFKAISLLVDEETSVYGSFSLWETKEEAEAVREAAGARAQQAIVSVATGEINVRIFEVYEPRG